MQCSLDISIHVILLGTVTMITLIVIIYQPKSRFDGY